MSKEGKKKKPNNGPDNVAQLPQRCPVDGCGKKAERMHFCNEHYAWFKEGLITKTGEKPKDFDKKYAAYQRKIAAKAA